MDFLGYVVTKGGFAISPSKVEAIQSWPVHKSRTQLRGFLGLSNYCRKFVPDFSEIVLPLTSLTSDKVPFSWSQDAENAFHTIKEMFISTPVLLMPDPSKEFFLETDASNFAVGAVLLQLGGMSYYILFHTSARSTFLQKKTTLFMIRSFFQSSKLLNIGADTLRVLNILSRSIHTTRTLYTLQKVEGSLRGMRWVNRTF